MKCLLLLALLLATVLAAPPTLGLLEAETGKEPSPSASDLEEETPFYFYGTYVPAAVKFALWKKHIQMKDRKGVLEKINKMIAGGVKGLVVISDFDHTMSRAYDEKGEKCWSSHDVFNQAPIPHLTTKMMELKNKYWPIEYNETIPKETKIPLMEQWWNKSHEAIVAEGVTRGIFENWVNISNIKLRDHAKELMGHLETSRVPLVMFSAGIGDVISVFLKLRLGEVPSNMHLIGNMMIFDDKDVISGFREPLIHTFNKNHLVINKNDETFMHEMRQRDNVILMGDSLGDPSMDIGVDNHSVDRTLKIGFLNKRDHLLETYKDVYDIVIVDDQSMDVPRTIIDAITSARKKNI